MNRWAAGVVGLVTLTSIAGAAALPSSASVERASYTKKYVLYEIGSHNVGKTTFVGADRATSAATGKVVGFDSYSGKFDFSTETAVLRVGFSLRGGMILARVKISNSTPDFTGTILGGSGAYAGITGTVSGKQVEGTKKTRLTLHYEL